MLEEKLFSEENMVEIEIEVEIKAGVEVGRSRDLHVARSCLEVLSSVWKFLGLLLYSFSIPRSISNGGWLTGKRGDRG